MPAIYLKLLVDFDDDEKVARLARYGRDARGCRDLLVAAWRYCKRNRTDGKVPEDIIGKLVYPDPLKIGLRDVERLIDVGLAERVPEGYYFPGFLKHNHSSVQIDEIAKRRAEAGAKGGKASKLPEKSEATDKQGASVLLDPVEPIDRDRDRQQTANDNAPITSGGERPEPLRAVPATDPPNNDELCTRHPNGNTSNEACRGCQRVEERKERRAAREAEQRARALKMARINCTRCDGVWITNPDGTPTRRKCDHGSAGVGRTQNQAAM